LERNRRPILESAVTFGGREAPVKKLEAYITTSWDDGNPLDLRVAELLIKHGLPGTFYVPMTADTGTMTVPQIRELGSAFEIGAHTIHHVVLTQTTKEGAWREIVDSKSWLEDTIGRACHMFCAPTGAFSQLHLEMIRRAGFNGLRTVELGSLDLPRRRNGLVLMPTTVQAYPHGLATFARNATKRMAFANLWRFVAHGRTTDWPELARRLLQRALDKGGVFHLWGHSWELSEADQWTRLDEVLQAMKDTGAKAWSLENGQIAQRFLTSAERVGVSTEQEGGGSGPAAAFHD
jgi:peptidoglycan/xylan/chitin deacetylase (PgdA/CDA1 family)